ncbi:glycosyl transferase [Metarhizium album ARSEF 1941]|uniref:Glycosyl transferase n=1 Tax=Metarhizium album (strain ARSEF 1941) TaxID=1081103 RepID=A0A0B2WPT2_METAS|nr:glycosyl transferase [Metarhizium album ARSEF 1941]KHN95492.1 glycosyl transferase [Metarhizium album ARSEF 1941]
MLFTRGVSPRRITPVLRKAYRNVPLVSAITILMLLAHYFQDPLHELIHYVHQIHPWSGQRQIEQPFSPTEGELACLRGATKPHDLVAGSDSSSNSSRIPNVVRFTYVFQEPLAQKHGIQFDFVNYLAVRSAIVTLRPDELYLHYALLSPSGNSVNSKLHPLTNPWIRRLGGDIRLVEHKIENPHGEPVHRLHDLARLQILRDNGGILLDADSFALKPFTNILDTPTPQDAVLGYEGGNRWGMRNAVMVARKNSTFINDWLDELTHARPRRQISHESVTLPKQLASRKPAALCALSPRAFFWPTWTWRHVGWMHEELSDE